MMGNYIVNQQYYDEQLSMFHTNDTDIKLYFNDEFVIADKNLQKAEIFKENHPELKIPAINMLGQIFGGSDTGKQKTEYDFENAVSLHESMKINKVQASDERLWSYLCHVPYFDFVKKRYKPERAMKLLELEEFHQYDNEKDRTTIRNYLKNRFFTGTDNRSLRRNGIAFLWWAIELTKSPWNKYEGIPKEEKDDFFYSKIILDDNDIYASTFERTIGKEPSIVFPLLDCIKENDLGRSQYRELIKKINSDVHLYNYSLLPYKDVRSKIEKLID